MRGDKIRKRLLKYGIELKRPKWAEEEERREKLRQERNSKRKRSTEEDEDYDHEDHEDHEEVVYDDEPVEDDGHEEEDEHHEEAEDDDEGNEVEVEESEKKRKKKSGNVLKDKKDWKKIAFDVSGFKDNAMDFISLEELDGSEATVFTDSTTAKTTKKEDKKDKKDKNKQDKKDESSTTTQSEPKEKKKKNKKNKKKKNKKQPKQQQQEEEVAVDEDIKEEDVLEKMKSWGEFNLHMDILKGLYAQKFFEPTPIQKTALGPAIRGRKDVVGAAQTGSGKTLAFGLPILNAILEEVNMEENLGIIKKQKQQEQSEVNNEEEVHEEEEETKEEIEEGNEKEKEELTKLAALIMTPTRELAIQVRDHLKIAAKFTPIKIATIVGGLSVYKQRRLLSKQPHIIVATPGRLWQMIENREENMDKALEKIRYFVLDEADRMIEQGHYEELDKIIARLPASPFHKEENEKKKKKKRKQKISKEEMDEQFDFEEEKKFRRQLFVFSATLTFEPAFVQKIRQAKGKQKKGGKGRSPLEILMDRLPFSKKVELVDLTAKDVIVDTLEEAKIECLKTDKDLYLYYILRKFSGRTLVFVNSIDCIRHIMPLLSILNVPVWPLHAEMQQRQRLKNLDRFKSNPNGVLIATDVAARGLDIPFLDHVVHYQLPRTAELYVHRSGRTARARAKGISIMLIDPADMSTYKKIVSSLANGQDLPHFPTDAFVITKLRKILQIAKKVDNIEHNMSKLKSDKNWFIKNAEAMEIELDDDFFDSDDDAEHKKKQQREQARALREQISVLLAQPVSTTPMKKYLLPEQANRLLKGITTEETAIEALKHKRRRK